jgi:hypothetical protein
MASAAASAAAATVGPLGAGPAAAARNEATQRRDEDETVRLRTPHGIAHARNVEITGYCSLNTRPGSDRPGFKMAVHEKAGRWYLYVGHFWEPGWSAVDVTDPRRAKVLTYLPAPPNTIANQVTIAGDTMITAMEKIFPPGAGGTDPNAPFQEGVLIWDIADPARPELLSHWKTGGTGTHRNLYAGGDYVHLAANMPGFRGNIYVILDIKDRRNPKVAGRWWVPGQETGGDSPPGDPAPHTHGFCCGSGQHVAHHGPAYPVPGTDLVYLPYGAAGLIVLDISDVSRPRRVGHLPFSPPFHAQFGVHGVVPVPELGIAFANSEDISYGKGPAPHTSILDIKDPANPYLLSLLPEPVPPQGADYDDFATRGGWSGPHNFNHHLYHEAVHEQGNLLHVAHFNAGLRLYDVSNRRLPREIGFFLPPEPRRRYGYLPEPQPGTPDLVLQTEDVVVDRRGYIYITDKNQGMWILRYTGPGI